MTEMGNSLCRAAILFPVQATRGRRSTTNRYASNADGKSMCLHNSAHCIAASSLVEGGPVEESAADLNNVTASTASGRV